jgi:flagellar motor protein MotB
MRSYIIHAALTFLIIFIYLNSYSFSIGFKDVDFESGRPFPGDSMEKAVREGAVSIEILDEISSLLITYQGIKVKVIGGTDNRECSNKACDTLSLRRAQYVHKWLLAHGVRPEQLGPPEGHGNREPLDYNATEEGRSRNRRAEIYIISVSGT